MTALVTCDQIVSSLTSALESATPAQIAALNQAMADAGVGGLPDGVGTGGFVAGTSGTLLPDDTAVTLASWTAPRAGKIAVSFSYGCIFQPTIDGTATARVTKNGAIVATSTARRDVNVAFCIPSASRAYLEVNAGDVIAGVAFANTSDASTSSTQSSSSGAFGLSVHYFA